MPMPVAWKIIAWLAVLVSALLPGVAHAQMDRHIEAALFAETRAPAPGEDVRIAIRMTPEPGWHGYWINPGDSGLPMSVEWEAPAGVGFGELSHPAPTLLDIQGIASYVHEGPFTLLATMTMPSGLQQGTALPITANLNWLACSDTLCVPESASLSTTLRVGEGAPDAQGAAVIRDAALALPDPLSGATYARQGGEWMIDIPDAARIDPAKARLYPIDNGWFAPGALQTIERLAAGLRISVAALEGNPGQTFSGVISDGRSAYEIRAKMASAGQALPMEASPSPPSPADSGAGGASGSTADTTRPVADQSSPDTPRLLLTSLLGAILGGLLLNLMPCVFPILSLKALSLARSGNDRAEARREGLGYAAGSIGTAMLLGGILIALKAAGQEVGWSFQLQSPLMILLLLVLTSVIALNLAGLFEFRLPALAVSGPARGGWAGGLATGALAALIATPCSGPFMAGALGAALVLPPAAALAIFAGLGLGMALPFLAIAWISALQQRMPKPGPWMETLRRLLALPMLATALALAWVLGRQTGVDGMTAGIALVAVTGTAFWWFGCRQRSGASAWPALFPAAIALGAVLVMGLPATEPASASVAGDSLHQPFSRETLAELRAAGTPVFVDFTADWCLTCKVNEKMAIETEAVQTAFEEAGVVTLTGDWTRGDPAITRFLADHGRNSIPFYLYYAPNRPGKVLPQLLSIDDLVNLPAKTG